MQVGFRLTRLLLATRREGLIVAICRIIYIRRHAEVNTISASGQLPVTQMNQETCTARTNYWRVAKCLIIKYCKSVSYRYAGNSNHVSLTVVKQIE